MTDSNKLKGKIVEKGFSITSFAKHLNISKTTLSQKINNKVRFSSSDIKKISEELELSADEIRDIFLN